MCSAERAGTAAPAASTATDQAPAAAGSAALAGTHASNAQTSETNAGLQATAAGNSAAAAAVSAGNASNSEGAAAASSSAAAGNALYAEGMAKGTQNGTPVASDSPYYENNAAYWAGEAQSHTSNAIAASYYSEAMAKGTINGTPVASGDPGYEDNAEYYKDQAAAQAAAASAASADGTNAQKMIAAPEEATSTAAAAHAAGTYFRYNSKLYKATQDIPLGGTITPNTNCVEDTVCAELTAQSEQIGELKNAVGELRDEVGGGKTTITSESTARKGGYYVKNSSDQLVFTESENYYSVEPIDISSLMVGSNLTMKSSLTSTIGIFITDASLKVLDFINGNNAEDKGYTANSQPQIVTMKVPTGAKYITTDIRTAYYTDMSDFDVNGVMPNNFVEIDADIDSLESKVGGGSVVISTDASKLIENKWYGADNNNKLVLSDGNSYDTIPPVDISGLIVGTEVKIKSSLSSNYGAYITDSAMNILDYVNGNNAVSKGYEVTTNLQLITFTVPNNAKYIVSDIRNASSIFKGMSDFDVYGTSKDNIAELREDVNALAVNGNVLSGKKWVACGDSFTAGAFTNSLTDDYTFTSGKYAGNYKVYPFWIGNRNEFMTVVNEAVAGSTMGAGTNGVNPFSGTRYLSSEFEDADYITLEFGINDSGNEVPIGTINDADNTTFYGAWNVVLGYFTEHYPFAHIGIIVGPGMQGTGQDYANAEIAVAKAWGIPYLNIQFESGGKDMPLMLRTSNPDVLAEAKAACDARQYVNPSEETPNYHPNEKAHEFESAFIEEFLRRI